MLAALAIAALFALADAQNQCRSALIGIQTADARVLRDTVMPRGYQDFDVTIPPNVCAPERQLGTSITACDYDVGPSPSLQDLLHGHVHRNGNYFGEDGVVHVTVYCG